MYLCLDNFKKKKLVGGMFHCTFSNNWPKLATLADNGARTKEHKAQRTKGAKKNSCPRAARPLSKGKFCGCLISAALLYNVK